MTIYKQQARKYDLNSNTFDRGNFSNISLFSDIDSSSADPNEIEKLFMFEFFHLNKLILLNNTIWRKILYEQQVL